MIDQKIMIQMRSQIAKEAEEEERQEVKMNYQKVQSSSVVQMLDIMNTCIAM